jgi:hypothetical protein
VLTIRPQRWRLSSTCLQKRDLTCFGYFADTADGQDVMKNPIRRVVTGHDDRGKSVVVIDGNAPMLWFGRAWASRQRFCG